MNSAPGFGRESSWVMNSAPGFGRESSCGKPEVPKALLPLANRPVLSDIVDLLDQSNLKGLIVVLSVSAFRGISFEN
ncbi:hypothetical protein CDL15_Pgr010257 [Punica granatum]|uniref:Uncharacterized protein n=1 Tax=Punica granatum TaxID=22663 RepID=A0A218WWY7_PUNGR|nr:hypothetical protein CDL15_Pgr010257 [Punica granatum]